MPTRPLLGESSFQTLSIPHLCYRRTSGHWRGNKLWVADEDAIVSKQDGNGLSREPQSCCCCSSTVHGPTPILYTVTFWLPCGLKYPITRFTAEKCCSLLLESSTTYAGSVLTISCIDLFLSLFPNWDSLFCLCLTDSLSVYQSNVSEIPPGWFQYRTPVSRDRSYVSFPKIHSLGLTE